MTTHQNLSAPVLRVHDSLVSMFPGGGIAGEVLRNTDWPITLGPVEAWSMSLKAHVRAMLNTLQPTCLLWGPELIHLYNDGYIPILAEKHPLAMGRRGQEVYSDAWPIVGKLLNDVVAHGQAVLFAEMLIPIVREGRLKDAWWNYSYSPVFDDTGAIAGVLVVATETTDDVARRKRLEVGKIQTELARLELINLAESQRDINERLLISSLREQESAEGAEQQRGQLSALLEALAEGVVIANASDGSILMLNEAAREIMGIAAAAAQNSMDQISALDCRGLDNAPLPSDRRPLSRAMHGESFVDAEMILVRAGETRRVMTSGTRILDREGERVALAIIVLRDVTEVRLLEQQREEHVIHLGESLARTAESEGRFRVMADNIPQLAWVADAHSDGQISWFNRTWLEYTGCTIEEMKGSGWKSVLHPDSAARVAKKFEHHVKAGLDWEDTFPICGKGGQYRWFLSRMSVTRDVSGNVVRMFGTNTDTTEQREADQFKEQFIGILGHDLRNPLNAILMGANLLKAKANHDQVKTVGAIIQSAHRMTNMVAQLHDLTRSRLAGGIALERQRTDLSAHHHHRRRVTNGAPGPSD